MFIFGNKAKIETDLISLIPKVFGNEKFEKPIKDFFSSSSGIFNMFIEAESFEKAYQTYSEIKNYINSNYKDINIITVEENSYKEILSFLNKYKYNNLSFDLRKKLINGEGKEISESAAMNIFSPMFTPIFSSVDQDPFGLTYTKSLELIEMLSLGTKSLVIKNNVLYTSFENKDNIFLSIEIPQNINGQTGYISFFKNIIPYIEKINSKGDVKIYTGGVPIHSYYSQKSAQRDIMLISIISLCVIFLIFYISFKSIKPYIISVMTIAISSTFAYMLVSILFDSVHIFTFVFGTSLIGISIDYSIHFITDFIYENDEKKSLKNIKPSLMLAFATTVIAYALLSFSNISILKTLSIFSIFGMMSSILTVLIIYPMICRNMTIGKTNEKITNFMTYLLSGYKLLGNKYKIIMLVLYIICISLIIFKGVKYNFSAERLYSSPDFLTENEIKMAERLESFSVNDVIFVLGDNIEQMLVTEEGIIDLLGEENQSISVSKIMPSKKRQKENINLVRKELFKYLDYQAETLGLDEKSKDELIFSLKEAEKTYIDENIIKNSKVFSILENKISSKNDKYYSSIILENKLNDKTISLINADYKDKVFILSMQEDITSALYESSKEAMLFTLIAYILIFALVFVVFKKKAVIIVFVETLSLLCVIAMHSLFGIEINIFSILALILSLGISIDYILFFMKSSIQKEIVYLSILLSMLTTILSFGTLSLSAFIPVASFGISLFFGVLFSFLLAPIVNISYNK